MKIAKPMKTSALHVMKALRAQAHMGVDFALKGECISCNVYTSTGVNYMSLKQV